MPLLRIYLAQCRREVAIWFQYRAAMLIWLIGTVVSPTVYLVVWTTVARSQGGQVGTYGVSDLAAYFITYMLVNHLTFTWHMWEYDYIIREGQFSALLLLPIHPIHGDIAENLVYKVLSLIVLLPAAVVMALVFKPTFHSQAWSLGLAGLALILAYLIRFLLGYLVAMAAFWTSRISAVNQLYYVAELFFSGQLTPLDLLPGPLYTVAQVLPFQWGTAFPVALILGQLTPAAAWLGLGVQLLWLGVILVTLRVVWRRALRQYAAFGA